MEILLKCISKKMTSVSLSIQNTPQIHKIEWVKRYFRRSMIRVDRKPPIDYNEIAVMMIILFGMHMRIQSSSRLTGTLEADYQIDLLTQQMNSNWCSLNQPSMFYLAWVQHKIKTSFMIMIFIMNFQSQFLSQKFSHCIFVAIQILLRIFLMQ